jgi:hypothetical protein
MMRKIRLAAAAALALAPGFASATVLPGPISGDVGGITNLECAAPTVTAAAYTAGNVVGGLVTLPNIFGPKNSGVIESVQINFKSAQTAEFDVSFFKAQPSNSTFTDHAAPAIAAADAFSVLPLLQLTNPKSVLGTETTYGQSGLGTALNTGSTSLWLVVTTPGTPTPASTTDMQVCVTVLAD